MPDFWFDVDAALSEVPVNIFPLIDDTDFKTRETAVAYNAAGMDLVWNFVTTAGSFTQTAVTPTTGGNYDWTHQGDGIYTIEIPASGGASINNDTEGFGWFTGLCTGVLPWRGPTIGFRASGINDALIDSAWSTTRGLAGTALPAAAADAAGGLPISDAGGLDLDAQLVTALNNASVQAGLASSRLQGLVIEQGSLGATGNDTTHIHLDGLTYGDDEINSHLVVIHDNSVSEYHSRWITDWVLSTELATVATLPFTPESADAFWLLSIRADVTGGSGLDAAGVRAAIGLASANLDDQLSTIDNFVDDIESRLGTPSDLGSGATVAANLVDIESQTDDIGVAGAGLTEAGGTGDHLTAVPWNATWDAQVESEVTDALNAYDPPTRTELTSDINSVLAILQGLVLETAVIGSTGNDTTHIHLDGLTYGDDEINNHLLVIFDASTSEYHARWIEDWVLSTELATIATLPFTPQNATDTFYLLPIRQDVTGGSGLDAAGVRAAIGMASANLDTQLDALPTAAEVWAAGTRTLTAMDEDSTTLDLDATIRAAVGLASADLDTQLGALPTATENADATLSRGVVNVEDTANTTSLAAVILAALESSVSGTTWTIRKTTGTTFVTKTVTVDAGADPVTGVT